VRSILDRPPTCAPPLLLPQQVPVDPGDVLLEAVVPLPAKCGIVVVVLQAERRRMRDVPVEELAISRLPGEGPHFTGA
jgi:hypothetical protein